MKMNKAIKRIVALGTGVTMVGATILGAMAAADLGAYPEPFVKDGAFNALIVVGSQAKTEDVLGSIDIATSLQYANRITRTVPGTTGSATIDGEGVKIEGSNNKLDIREDFVTAKPAIDKDDLPELLAKGTYVADGDDESDTYDYTQELAFSAGAEVRWYQDNDYDEDHPYLVAYSPADTKFMTYTLEFTKDAVGNFDAAGTGCGDEDELCDFEGTKIELLGVNYEVTNAAWDGTSAITWEMMGGTGLYSMYEGETKTFTIDGVDYEVTVDIVSDTGLDCQLTVNGVTTRELSRGETTKVAGIELGIKKLMPNEAGEEGAGKDLVQFYLGANKMTLSDTDVTTVSEDEAVKIGTEDSEVLFVDWTATEDGDELRLESMQLAWIPNEIVMFEAGDSVTFPLGNYQVSFAGLAMPSTEEISFSPTGDDKIRVSVPLEGGDVSMDMLYFDGTVYWFGDTDTAGEGLILTGDADVVTKGDYVLLSDATEFETHMLKLKDIDSNNVVKFEDVATGDLYEKSCAAGCTVRVGATDVVIASINEGANTLVLEATGSDLSNTLYTPEGLEIAFAGGGAATELITIQEENADGTVSAGDRFTLLADVDAATETTIGTLTALDASLSAEYEDGDNTDKYVVMSDYGTKITLDKSDSRESADIVYPSEQAYADVFVNGIDTQITEGTEGGATYGDVQRIEVGAAVLDTEVANIAAQNVIVVGGPCVNTLAAELMGNPADCTTGFEDGKAMIKLFDQTGGKVAMLVAGYSAMDTRRASRVVANYEDYSNFDGTELEVTGTSLSDITVSAPQ